MEKPTDLKAAFESIMSTRSFERLEPFKRKRVWLGLSGDERQLLANLLVLQGEALLKQKESGGEDSFQLALQVSGGDPRILYRLGTVYASQRRSGRCLRQALVYLEDAVSKAPYMAEAFEVWGSVLVRLGVCSQDMATLQEANEKFEKAAELYEKEKSESLDGTLYWHWGECWFHLGRSSGEAMDFRCAIDKFQAAEKMGAAGVDFWRGYGDAIYELGRLIGRFELVEEAVEAYRKAISDQKDRFDCWLHLALALKSLYEWNLKEELFEEANEAFEYAAQLCDTHLEVWWKWGELIGHAGWLQEDAALLKLAAEKLSNADLIDGEHPQVLCLWGTVLMHCGGISERLPLLKQAEEKILRSVELDPENMDAWCAYGSVLCELGYYFGDDEYYVQAMARYQYALTLEPDCTRLWQGLAHAQFAAAELQEDLSLMERSLEAYGKAAECEQQRSPELWADWGIALMKVGDLIQDRRYIEAAVQRFEQAIHLHSDGDCREVRWLYHYGCAMDILGDYYEGSHYYERAAQVLSHVLSLHPGHRPARYALALALFHLAEASLDVEIYNRSLNEFERVLAMDSEDELAWNDWGVTLLTLSDMLDEPSRPTFKEQLEREAEEKLTRAASLGSVQAFYNLACLCSLTGRYGESLHFLHKAAQNHALPPLEELRQDEWLQEVRETEGYLEFERGLERSTREFPPGSP